MLTNYEQFLLQEIIYECSKIYQSAPRNAELDKYWERINELVRRILEEKK